MCPLDVQMQSHHAYDGGDADSDERPGNGPQREREDRDPHRSSDEYATKRADEDAYKPMKTPTRVPMNALYTVERMKSPTRDFPANPRPARVRWVGESSHAASTKVVA